MCATKIKTATLFNNLSSPRHPIVPFWRVSIERKQQMLFCVSIHFLLSQNTLLWSLFSKQRHHSRLFVQQQLLWAYDPSSNLIGQPVSLRSDGENIDTYDEKKNLFFTPYMIAPRRAPYCFDSKPSSRQTFAPNFRVQRKKTLKVRDNYTN